MLRVILPSLQRKSSNRIILQITFFFLLSSFIWCFYIKFLAEWIAIKRPNLSHVIPISLEITILLLVGFFEKAIYQHYQGNGLPFQCSFHGSTKFYGDANIKLYC
jgi:hypothetical protein